MINFVCQWKDIFVPSKNKKLTELELLQMLQCDINYHHQCMIEISLKIHNVMNSQCYNTYFHGIVEPFVDDVGEC